MTLLSSWVPCSKWHSRPKGSLVPKQFFFKSVGLTISRGFLGKWLLLPKVLQKMFCGKVPPTIISSQSSPHMCFYIYLSASSWGQCCVKCWHVSPTQTQSAENDQSCGGCWGILSFFRWSWVSPTKSIFTINKTCSQLAIPRKAVMMSTGTRSWERVERALAWTVCCAALTRSSSQHVRATTEKDREERGKRLRAVGQMLMPTCCWNNAKPQWGGEGKQVCAVGNGSCQDWGAQQRFLPLCSESEGTTGTTTTTTTTTCFLISKKEWNMQNSKTLTVSSIFKFLQV